MAAKIEETNLFLYFRIRKIEEEVSSKNIFSIFEERPCSILEATVKEIRYSDRSSGSRIEEEMDSYIFTSKDRRIKMRCILCSASKISDAGFFEERPLCSKKFTTSQIPIELEYTRTLQSSIFGREENNPDLRYTKPKVI